MHRIDSDLTFSGPNLHRKSRLQVGYPMPRCLVMRRRLIRLLGVVQICANASGFYCRNKLTAVNYHLRHCVSWLCPGMLLTWIQNSNILNCIYSSHLLILKYGRNPIILSCFFALLAAETREFEESTGKSDRSSAQEVDCWFNIVQYLTIISVPHSSVYLWSLSSDPKVCYLWDIYLQILYYLAVHWFLIHEV